MDPIYKPSWAASSKVANGGKHPVAIAFSIFDVLDALARFTENPS